MTKELESLPMLGEGRTASVYALDEKRVLKLFKKAWDREAVEEIYIRSTESCSAGIPFVKAYEVVEVDGRYGLILDRIDGESVDVLLAKAAGRERLKLLELFTDAVKKIHRTSITSERLPDQKQFAAGLVDRLPGLGFTQEETDAIRRIVDSAAESDVYLHGDCHTGNAVFLQGDCYSGNDVYQNGEILFLDADYFTGRGDPVFDLCCMYSHYVFMPSLMDDGGVERYIGMTREEGEEVYLEFIGKYFSEEDSETIDRIKTDIVKMQAAKVCLAYAFRPAVFDRGIIDRVVSQPFFVQK